MITGLLAAAGPAFVPWYNRVPAPFTLLHLVPAGVAVALITGAVWWGRRTRGTAAELRLRYSWAGFAIWMQVVANIYYFHPDRFRWHWSLPLQLCDIAALVAGFALLLEARWLRTVIYYWGIGLSTQAFVTPTLREPFSDPHFQFFWWGHLHIVGSAVYFIAVLGYRPRWRDLWVGSAASFAFALVAGVANALIPDANYGYLANTRHEHATIINLLGPWPLRVLWVVVIVHVIFVAITAPFELARRRGWDDDKPKAQ